MYVDAVAVDCIDHRLVLESLERMPFDSSGSELYRWALTKGVDNSEAEGLEERTEGMRALRRDDRLISGVFSFLEPTFAW